MPVWRCPHCGTPQAESSRCWVCRRSTTSCATCRHFRRGITAGLGLCGLDPRRTALLGSEMRACWSAPDPQVEAAPGSSPAAESPRPAAHEGRRSRTFVPVEGLAAAPAEPTPVIASPPVPGTPPSPGWSLWGDADL